MIEVSEVNHVMSNDSHLEVFITSFSKLGTRAINKLLRYAYVINHFPQINFISHFSHGVDSTRGNLNRTLM